MANIRNFKAYMNKLKGSENWALWQKQVKLLLAQQGVIDVVVGNAVSPNKDEIDFQEKLKKFKQDDLHAQFILLSCMDELNVQLTSKCGSSKAVWDKLIWEYELTSDQRLDGLMELFFAIEKEESENISTYIARLQTHFYELNNELSRVVNCELPELLLMSRVMSSLPKEYVEFKSVWQSVPVKERTLNQLIERLRLIEMRLPEKKEDLEAPVMQVGLESKSKGNSEQTQQGKEKLKQQAGVSEIGGSINKPAPVANTQHQSSLKSNKMTKLNLKGANKESTDMDAFSIASDTPAPVTPVYAQFTASPQPTQQQQPVPATAPAPDAAAPVIAEEEVVKVQAPPPAMQENRNETDRTPLSNDKLVQAKNEANAKTNIGNEQSEIKPLLYKEDQWCLQNPKEKKSYDRDSLMALRSNPKSKTKPDNIINEILAGVDRSAANRDGQKDKLSGIINAGKLDSVICVSIDHRANKEDVNLDQTENACKSVRLNSSVMKTVHDSKIEYLCTEVRGILNQRMPQKPDVLMNQIKTLSIDTMERLQCVVDLVFEKAVDEPNLSGMYALMCRELAGAESMQVLVSPDSKEFINFRKLLVTRCQIEFEKNSSEESNRNARIVEIEACTDPEKKKEMLATLDEDDRRIRMKSVGNIRFIGELFKQQMLTQNIMVRSLYNLIENEDEERLECLCKLLSTIGKDLEVKNVNLTKIFDQMRNIVARKKGKVSSRVRFMLQDVIDLRNGGWVPRRTDLNPKTIEQIQKKPDHEQMTIAAMNSGPITPYKDDRKSSNSGKRGGRSMNDIGWVTAGPRKTNQSFMLQADKLKIQNPLIGEPPGSRSLFSNWGNRSYKAVPTSNSDNK